MDVWLWALRLLRARWLRSRRLPWALRGLHTGRCPWATDGGCAATWLLGDGGLLTGGRTETNETGRRVGHNVPTTYLREQCVLRFTMPIVFRVAMSISELCVGHSSKIGQLKWPEVHCFRRTTNQSASSPASRRVSVGHLRLVTMLCVERLRTNGARGHAGPCKLRSHDVRRLLSHSGEINCPQLIHRN